MRTTPASYTHKLGMALLRCSACNRFGGTDDSVACTEGCGAVYHVACATERLGYDPSDFDGCVLFHCDSCTVHRSSVTPRTSEGDRNCYASRGSLSPTTVTLDDVMQQLK